jgi:hypothetical protein
MDVRTRGSGSSDLGYPFNRDDSYSMIGGIDHVHRLLAQMHLKGRVGGTRSPGVVWGMLGDEFCDYA